MGLGKLLLNHQVGKYHHSSHTTSGGIPYLRAKDCLDRLIYFLQPPLYFCIPSLSLHSIYGFFYYYRSTTFLQIESQLKWLLNVCMINLPIATPHVSSWITSEYHVLRKFIKRAFWVPSSLSIVCRDRCTHMEEIHVKVEETPRTIISFENFPHSQPSLWEYIDLRWTSLHYF